VTHVAIADALTRVLHAEPAWSLLQRVVNAFNARRQREADRMILRAQRYCSDGAFRVEFERRLMGQ
jgi:hypothetical protein